MFNDSLIITLILIFKLVKNAGALKISHWVLLSKKKKLITHINVIIISVEMPVFVRTVFLMKLYILIKFHLYKYFPARVMHHHTLKIKIICPIL